MSSQAIASMDLAGKRVLLVGGAGFIGHNLALALRARGADVAIVDSLLLPAGAGARVLKAR